MSERAKLVRSEFNETALREKYAEFTYHGGPFDRGAADYYYGRPAHPHKFPNGTYNGPEVELTDATEIAAYWAGYDTQVERKDWGHE